MSYYRIGAEASEPKSDLATIGIVGAILALLAIKARPREGYVRAWRNA